ncbi:MULTISPECIES: hypothetical protein [unclassified Microcoleus]|uniref:hypothetical protein n=1 Tax=unclassified Microcoleus TaxID=2642155 RepID=UPI002FCF8DA2
MRVSVFVLCRYEARTVRSPYKTSHDVVEADRPLAHPASPESQFGAIEAWAHLLRLKKLNIF